MKISTLFLALFFLSSPDLLSQRQMETLDRGLIASRKNNETVFISWRMLGTDPSDISYNLYRNDTLLTSTTSTNFLDAIAADAVYSILPIVNGEEQRPGFHTNVLSSNFIEIPLSAGDYYVQHAWPGDLDGDGEFDLVVSRLPSDEGNPVLEAYKLDGTFLWQVDMGINASWQDPSFVGNNDAPIAAISGWGDVPGYRDNDNVTVYDLDNDGKSEVIVRTASGVIFNDGREITSMERTDQFISVINGETGTEKSRIELYDEKFSGGGPLSGHFGIAYLDGHNPSLIAKLENRQANRTFQLMVRSYDFDGKFLAERWTWRRTAEEAHNFHQIRVIDVNGDGKDDVCDGTYVINSDGTLLYTVEGAVHGDRFHLTDMDPTRPGLEGYAIQQAENGNTNQFPWYYYDAATGERLVTGDNPQDVGRGTVADIDPDNPGYEMWSVEGVWNKETKLYNQMPVANFNIWWDGDVLGELLDQTFVRKWNHTARTQQVLFSATGCRYTWRNAPPFYGDVIGDWREEVLWETSDHSALRLYTTTIPTEVRLYTLPHNPGYRNCLTVKGYYQSNLVDYYLGDGMEIPPPPNIVTNSLDYQKHHISMVEDQGAYQIIENLDNFFTDFDDPEYELMLNGNAILVEVEGTAVNASTIPEMHGMNKLAISATDNGETRLDTFHINVVEINDAPSTWDFSFSMKENRPKGFIIGTVTGADIDGDSLHYSIISGNKDSAFAIDSKTGNISIADSAIFDYEVVQQFELTVKVQDDYLYTQSNVTITLKDEDDVLGTEPMANKPMLFPNPLTDQLNIVWSDMRLVIIREVSGKHVMTTSERELSLGHLTPGLYLVTLVGRQGEKRQVRLIKN